LHDQEDEVGQPDVSYTGGMPGFVRVLDERTLAFPDYDGNGMFKSLGNVLANAKVGLLFVDFEKPNRMRVSGTASHPCLTGSAWRYSATRCRAPTAGRDDMQPSTGI
jgi:Pyridoxamine 5'-phosphate oxidase